VAGAPQTQRNDDKFRSRSAMAARKLVIAPDGQALTHQGRSGADWGDVFLIDEGVGVRPPQAASAR
jgi:hypothetical protein